jgi:hypothetical protein
MFVCDEPFDPTARGEADLFRFVHLFYRVSHDCA